MPREADDEKVVTALANEVHDGFHAVAGDDVGMKGPAFQGGATLTMLRSFALKTAQATCCISVVMPRS